MGTFKLLRTTQIRGEFTGFDSRMLFELADGSTWVQDESKYWFHYARNPDVDILTHDGKMFLRVTGEYETVAIREITDVIRSRIRGDYIGWAGTTSYELENGQFWEQATYRMEFRYAPNPEVVIYDPGDGSVMKVEGTTMPVTRRR